MFKLLRAKPTSLFSSLPNHLNRHQASGVRFAQAVSGSDQPDTSEKTDQTEELKSRTGETKSSSRGGYAKRSDEVGYGAELGGNKSLSEDDEDKISWKAGKTRAIKTILISVAKNGRGSS
ncbi:hypothetical protein DH2020_012558 [Rehmannia glutinosa]|uniref:Uncharacterized protein n=1 Tax=Rehmannia glutinosa TaxID=99300 RepID=A0ABR0X0F1_REHGL